MIIFFIRRTCPFQFSELSEYSPRYLIDLEKGTLCPFTGTLFIVSVLIVLFDNKITVFISRWLFVYHMSHMTTLGSICFVLATAAAWLSPVSSTMQSSANK